MRAVNTLPDEFTGLLQLEISSTLHDSSRQDFPFESNNPASPGIERIVFLRTHKERTRLAAVARNFKHVSHVHA